MDIYQVIINNMRINGSEDCSTSEFKSDVEAAAKIINLHIAALEARLAEAEEILTFIAYEDMQILENGYQAEEMATKWLDKNPGGDLI